MKAKEYFEKYFTDLDSISAEEIENRLRAFFKAMNAESRDICNMRHVKLDSGVLGVLREQTNKWNAVGRLIEKKYGVLLLKQDGFINYWNCRLNRED